MYRPPLPLHEKLRVRWHGSNKELLHVQFQAEDGIRDVERSRGLGDVYNRQGFTRMLATLTAGSKNEICTTFAACQIAEAFVRNRN